MYVACIAADYYAENAMRNMLRRHGTFVKPDDHLLAVNRRIAKFEFDADQQGAVVRTFYYLTDHWRPICRSVERVVETDSPKLQEMLATPDPVEPDLDWCIAAFRERFARTGDYWSALGSCTVVSQDFIWFCRYKGCPERMDDITVYFGDPAHATPDFPRECHTVVEVKLEGGGVRVVDWTARQFGGDADYPEVWVNKSGTTQVFPPR